MTRHALAAAAALVLAVLTTGVAQARNPVPPTLPSDDAIFRTIEEITSKGPRRLGTPGGDFAVDYVKGRLERAGVQDVHVEQTPAWSWEVLREAVRFGGREVDASPAVYSMSPAARAVGDFSTPAGGLRSQLVDIRGAKASDIEGKDLRGKVVLFDLDFLLPLAGLVPLAEFIHDPGGTLLGDPKALTTANPYVTNFSDAVKAAQDAGAAGFIGILGDYFESNEYHNEFYRRLVVKIPGFWVTRSEGARLRAELAADPATTVELELSTRRREVPASAVVGVLPGRSTDAIMVQSHHDSAFVGAVEDGSGVAEVIALAEHFGAQPASSRAKTLMFTTFDSHFTGYQAHFAFTRRHLLDRDPRRDPHRIVANVTLEHIAKAASIGPRGELVVSELAEPRGVFENFNPLLKAELIGGVVRNDLRRTVLLNGTALQPLGVPTDASFALVAGIPTASLIAGPLYLYDAADTLDKVLKGDLQRVAQAFAEFIDAVDETPSETIGLVPLSVSLALGRAASAAVTGERGTEVSVDRVEATPAPSCTPARRGRPVAAARLRRVARVTRLTFRARRTQAVRVVVRHRSGRTAVLRRLRRVRACRAYAVRLPSTVVAARITGKGGTTAVRRR